MAINETEMLNIWAGAETRGAEAERDRILTILDGLISHYAASHHPGLIRESRLSVLKALRLLKGRITDERNDF